jgi:hypothetical protein
MTGEYTPDLPRLRDLVDALADPDVDVDPAALRIDGRAAPAPDDVLAASRGVRAAWNAVLDATPRGRTPGPSSPSGCARSSTRRRRARRRALADRVRGPHR